MDFGSDFDGKTFYFATRESSLQDPRYRYRYNEPEVDFSGKKDNRTTYFINSEYFSEKLGMPSEYFGKYISGRLSCASGFDSNKNCLLFRGEFTQEQIKKFFFEFIVNYKICENCDYPEPVLQKNDKKILIKHCESCGHNSQVKCKANDKAYDFIDKRIKK